MTLARTLQEAAGNGISTGEVAEAIDFDGTNDCLSRASLTGNADSKTLTCSVFFYAASITGTDFLVSFRNNAVGQHFAVKVANNAVYIDGGNASATAILAANTPTSPSSIALNTWNHVLISIDLANTSNRRIYINDVVQSVTWSTYTNDSIAFSTNADSFRINALSSITGGLQGRLSNVYLDYTYRDLSVTNNRRLFVTADLKPAAGQAALSPILYLPMDDPTQPGLNLGTGGDFTLNGTVARSGRGPNQFNAPYSDLDGSADYLSRTSVPTGVVASKQVTFAVSFMADNLSAQKYIWSSWGGANIYFVLSVTTSQMQVEGKDSSGTPVIRFSISSSYYRTALGSNNHLVFSLDLSSTSLRKVMVNGIDITSNVSWQIYSNVNIAFLSMSYWSVGCLDNTPGGGAAQSFWNGKLGNVWFNTSYIDLSQPANLAKFVTGTGIDAKPVDLGATGELPTGTSPLIYLPMYGNNAGKNYGTGGDFTVNSGPYPGARGPNEFWGNKADFDGSTGYLARDTGISGIADSKTFSMSFHCSPDVSGTNMRVVSGNAGGTDNRLNILRQSTNDLAIVARNSAGATILEGYTTGVFTAGSSLFVQISIDMANTSNRFVYINGVANSVNWLTYTNDTIDFTTTYWTVGASYFSGSRNLFFDGKLSEFYLATNYIDFSQEANRLKFRDAFGNPVDLTPQIEAGAIPNPAIYMRFDPANQGLNSGTGGDFTKSGTILDGGQL